MKNRTAAHCALILVVLLALLVPAPLSSARRSLPPAKVEASPLVTGPADSAWPMYQHDAQRTSRSPYVGPENPFTKWTYPIPSGSSASPAIASDGTIYVGSNNNKFYAVRANGTSKWQYDISSYSWSSPAIAADGSVYFGYNGYTSGNFVALNAFGALLWQYPAREVRSSPVIGGDGTIYVGSFRELLIALDSDGSLLWQEDRDGEVYSSPAIGPDGTIYIAGTHERYLHAVTSAGTVEWSYPIGDAGDTMSSPTVDDNGTIYVGGSDNKLYAVNPDGTLKWTYPVGDVHNARQSAAIGPDGTVYVIAGEGVLYALTPAGSLKWGYIIGSADLDTTPTVDAGGVIYFGARDGKVYAINPDGTEKWTHQTPAGALLSSIAINSDGTLYVAGDGGLYAIGEGGPGGDNRVYVPLAARNYDLALPPVAARNHTTGADGLVTVYLAGGGTAEFRLVDRLEQPVANVPVVSLENEFGVTILAVGHSQGFFPKLFSAPSALAAQNASLLARAMAGPLDVPLVPIGASGLHDEEGDVIYGHLLSLPQNMEEWERKNRTVHESCEMAGIALDGAILVATYITAPAHLGIGILVHAVFHAAIVAGIEGVGVPACKQVFGPNPVQVHASIENDAMGVYFLDWEATIQNTTGVLFGQVVDADSQDGLGGVGVWLDSSFLSIAKTFPNGWYRFDGVPGGLRSVYSEREGYTSDTVTSISVSPNKATLADALELELTNPGTWRIQNDTGGTMTVDLQDVGIRTFDTGSNDWKLPPGTYNFTAWTVGCGGVVDSSVTIYAGLISSMRFYCAKSDGVLVDATAPDRRPVLR